MRAGTFTGVSIDENGYLYASYSSGFSKVIYQVPVVDVPNPNGLRVLDNQCFALSQDAGVDVPLGRGQRTDRRRSRASRASSRRPTSRTSSPS